MPITKDDLEAVKALAKAGRITEARNLLEDFDDERARAALVKFNERYPVTKVEPLATPPYKENKPEKIALQRNPAIWLMAGIAIAALLFALLQIPAIRNLITNVPGRLQTVCIYQGIDMGYDVELEPGEISQGCSLAVPYAMSVYAEEIQLCVDTRGQTNFTLQDCLEEQGVYLDAKYELEHAK